MPDWSDILNEVNASKIEAMRREYLNDIANYTKRNVLVYYSGWLQVPTLQPYSYMVNDSDKTGLMSCCHGVDRTKGLDLILHTPGGDIAATESIIDYLISIYNGNVRAFVPLLAMSCGTLIAVSCKEIWMGRQSSIGPVDPQFGNIPAMGILDQFELAYEEIKADPTRLAIWSPILQKLGATDIIQSKRAVEWSNELLEKFLTRNMFSALSLDERSERLERVKNLLGKQETSKTHSRHINAEKASEAGLIIKYLEDDDALQDKILSLHHLLCITFDTFKFAKIIANDIGKAYIVKGEI